MGGTQVRQPRNVTLTIRAALGLLLDQVDYKARACRPYETVGSVLNEDTIDACRSALVGNRINPELLEWRGQFWRVTDNNRERLETLLKDLEAERS